MTGVSILAMEEVAVEFSFNWIVFWISFGISLILSCILAVNMTIDYDFKAALPIIIFGLFVGAIFGTMFGKMTQIPIEYENIYKVTITNEVSMAEFMDKYEVIEQEGKIYTVRERN